MNEETKTGEPSAEGEHEVIRQDIMPILGLQISSAPYPFMAKDHMDKIRTEISSALPQDRDILKYIKGFPDFREYSVADNLKNISNI